MVVIMYDDNRVLTSMLLRLVNFCIHPPHIAIAIAVLCWYSGQFIYIVAFLFSYNSSMDDQERFAELQLLLAQARHHVQNAENTDLAVERKLRAKLEQQLAEEKNKREELEQRVQMREKNPSTNNQSMVSQLVIIPHK